MKIQRYTAASMREALALIRAEQGEEAVILSTRRLEEGVEVVSAIDYDAALMGDAARLAMTPQAPSPAAVPSRSVAIVDAPPAPVETPRALAVPAAPRTARHSYYEPPDPPPPQFGELQQEMRDMRRLLESELAVMGWKHQRQSDPFSAAVMEELTGLDIAPDITRALAQQLPRRTNAKNPAHIPMALLMKYLPMVNDATCEQGGVVAVVGPTGVGKTTTIAKLAARWCLRHGNQDLALVSTDGYRIGARDQLLTYARILDVPMHVADGGRQLAQVLERLKHKRLVLVDTAGMSQRDTRIPEQLDSLRLGLGGARVLLALPAGAEARAVDEIVRMYGRIAPESCVLTKIDESASLGAAFSTVLRRSLPISYLCDGQRVPEDLHDAERKRLWLVRTALDLRQRHAPPPDESFMAKNFGRTQLHA
jgi:flagellar biosynthesis protein FlhF